MCSSLAWEEVGAWREQVGGTGLSWMATAARRDTWGMCPRGEDLPCGSLGRRRKAETMYYMAEGCGGGQDQSSWRDGVD